MVNINPWHQTQQGQSEKPYDMWAKGCTSMVSCQKGPTRHAYAWQIGPFWQDTHDVCGNLLLDFFKTLQSDLGCKSGENIVSRRVRPGVTTLEHRSRYVKSAIKGESQYKQENMEQTGHFRWTAFTDTVFYTKLECTVNSRHLPVCRLVQSSNGLNWWLELSVRLMTTALLFSWAIAFWTKEIGSYSVMIPFVCLWQVMKLSKVLGLILSIYTNKAKNR